MPEEIPVIHHENGDATEVEGDGLHMFDWDPLSGTRFYRANPEVVADHNRVRLGEQRVVVVYRGRVVAEAIRQTPPLGE